MFFVFNSVEKKTLKYGQPEKQQRKTRTLNIHRGYKQFYQNPNLWPGLLEAWLVPTSVKCHGNL